MLRACASLAAGRMWFSSYWAMMGFLLSFFRLGLFCYHGGEDSPRPCPGVDSLLRPVSVIFLIFKRMN